MSQAIASRIRRPLRALATIFWPNALYVALPATPHPETIFYRSGPVPWIDIRAIGTVVVYRCYVGETFEIPWVGAGWEVRPATTATDVLVSSAGVPVTRTLDILLDVPPTQRGVGQLILEGTFTTAAGDPFTPVWRIATEGLLTLVYVLQVTTFAAGATATHNIFQEAYVNAAILENTVLGALAALADRRTLVAGNFGWAPTGVLGTAPSNLGPIVGNLTYGVDGAVAAMVITYQLRGFLQPR